VRSNLENDTWLHCGTGKIQLDDYPNGTLLRTEDVFNEIRDEDKSEEGEITEENAELYDALRWSLGKPENGIWFSGGSWLFDPYSDQNHDSLGDRNPIKIIQTSKPEKILVIKDMSDLESFEEKYLVKGEKFVFDYINWNKVRDDGWYGVATHFRKVYHHLGINDNRHQWQWSWDVESLVVWDLRAFTRLEVKEVFF